MGKLNSKSNLGNGLAAAWGAKCAGQFMATKDESNFGLALFSQFLPSCVKSEDLLGRDSPNCSDYVATLDELSKGNLKKSGAGEELNTDGETAKHQPPRSTEISSADN